MCGNFELRQQVERLLLNDVNETAFLDPERLLSALSGRIPSSRAPRCFTISLWQNSDTAAWEKSSRRWTSA